MSAAEKRGWEYFHEFMVATEFDEETIRKCEGVDNIVDLMDRLNWDEFCYLMRRLSYSAWKKHYLATVIEMGSEVRYLMSEKGKKLHDELKSAGIIQLSDPTFLKRLHERSAEVFAEAAEESSKLAKEIIREFDQEAMRVKNLRFARALADQVMQIGCFMAANPGMPPVPFWGNLLMCGEILDRICRCMEKPERAEHLIRIMAKGTMAQKKAIIKEKSQ